MSRSFFNKASRYPFIKYCLIGGLAFIVEYCSFLILYHYTSLWVWLANALSFLAGLLLAFWLNRWWAFKTEHFHHSLTNQFGMYVGLAGINLLLTVGIVALLQYFGVRPPIGKLFAMVITSSWNFFLLRWGIFKHRSQKIG